MPAVGGSAGSYGPLIVTPDMVPPNAADWDAQEQVYRSGATTWDGIHQQIVRDNAVRRDAADSRGFDTAHEAGACLLYTSPSPRDGLLSRMPSSA